MQVPKQTETIRQLSWSIAQVGHYNVNYSTKELAFPKEAVKVKK